MKGTVSVLLGDPQCKDGNARFTMVPLKAFSDKVCIYKISKMLFL